jgi:threonyl-tRNA synthetase
MAMTATAEKRLEEDELLYKKRHSLAHVMAEAVLKLIPEAQIAIGPPVENGFYYDFELPRSLKEDDLVRIEAIMRNLLKTNAPFVKKVVSRSEAAQVFAGQKYKEEILAGLSDADEISTYTSNQFVDLCRGPHVEAMGQLDPNSFKLTRIAGAYWKGDERNAQLQRVYALAFHDQAGLEAHLALLEEAERRDHRRLGTELDLFHLDSENPGQVFWHRNGWSIWQSIEQYIRHEITVAGYQEVKTPFIMPQSLWERSGHWAKYRDNMFVTESEKRLFALKPMNCPGHVEIFKQGLKSYRELPLRIAEFGSCTRNEASGALHGIMRVRGFVQDDAHIFCTEDQVEKEMVDFCDLLRHIYRDFGFDPEKVLVRLAMRPDLRAGSDEVWDKAEANLAAGCRAAGYPYVEAPGEGAFYGPKLEFTLFDALGRGWQCGTIQIDYVLPSEERLNATYIGEDGQKHHPVMLHRAIVGSFERFIGILIENFAGAFPVWLNPVQAVVIPVSNKFEGYALKVTEALKLKGYRVEADTSDQKMGARIRDAQMRKASYMLVVGGNEETDGTVSIRTRSGEQHPVMKLDEFAGWLSEKVASKAML